METPMGPAGFPMDCWRAFSGRHYIKKRAPESGCPDWKEVMTTESSIFGGRAHETERKTMEVVLGGSSVEALGGIVAIVLAVIGLAGIFPLPLAAISIIALGVAFLSEGSAIAARYSELLEKIGGGWGGSVELARGVTTEFIGGVAGVVLGVLTLLGMAPMTLIAVALIVFGGTLLMSSAGTGRLGQMKVLDGEAAAQNGQFFHIAASAAPGGQILLGLSAVVLGIHALVMIGNIPMTLLLVGILCVGASLVFSGSAVAGRVMGIFR